MNHARTHLDLFSGIGGFALAARRCGVRTIGFCEKEPFAQAVLKKNFGAVDAHADDHQPQLTQRHHQKGESAPEPRSGDGSGAGSGADERLSAQGVRDDGRSASVLPKLHPDIRTLDGRQYAGVWLLTGGFPCQPFSFAGKRRGKEDDRHLWPEMLRVISEARPTWVIGENVAGFVSMELDNCVLGMENLGYTVQPLIIPACAVDAHHRRDRCWMLCHAQHNGQPAAQNSGAFTPGDDRGASGTEQAGQPAGSGQQQPPVANSAQRQNDGRNRGSVDEETGRHESGNTAIVSRSENVANPENNHGRSGERPAQTGTGADEQRGRGLAGGGEAVADRNGEGLERRAEAGDAGGSGTARDEQPERCCQWQDEEDWFAQSGMGRVADGLPRRVDRLKAFGNAIVPQVAEEIIRAMILFDAK